MEQLQLKRGDPAYAIVMAHKKGQVPEVRHLKAVQSDTLKSQFGRVTSFSRRRED